MEATMEKEHVKGVPENFVKNAEGNPISPQEMMGAHKLEEAKRMAQPGKIKGSGRFPARSAKNDPLYRE
jgi:hypothetical protein